MSEFQNCAEHPDYCFELSKKYKDIDEILHSAGDLCKQL